MPDDSDVPPAMPETPESDPATPAGAPRTPRFGPGFAWGLAVGTIVVVLIVVAGVVAMQYVAFSRLPGAAFGRGGGGTVVVSPVKAGADWFSIRPDGTGTLQAWSGGSSGSGDDSNVPGSVAFFDVGAIGSVDGVKVVHTVRMYVTAKTEFVIGGQPYQKGKSSSVAEAIFGGDMSPESDVLGSRPLTITFHRAGSFLVADKITAPLESSQNPLQF